MKAHPIAIVEIEVSPTSYEEETKRGKIANSRGASRTRLIIVLVIAAAAELDIAVAGYS